MSNPVVPDPIGVKGEDGETLVTTDNRFPVADDSLKDIFGHQIVVQPYNQVEMRLDAADWQDFTDTAVANGGSIAQSLGMVQVASGTSATGSAILTSTDAVEYRPGISIYAGGTAVFTTAAAGATQRIGFSDDTSFTNSLTFGYNTSGVFGIEWRRGGALVKFIPQADWDDPCLAAAGSRFTRDEAPEALDPTTKNLYRFECGLFGAVGWRAEVWSPDHGWITVYTEKLVNTGTVPVFQSNSLKVILASQKTSGATSLVIKSQCWGAGTGSPMVRTESTTSDRTLAMPVTATLRAKKPNNAYVNIEATTGGNLKVALEEVDGSVTVPISASALPLPSGASTEATLQLLSAYPLRFSLGQVRHVGASVTSAIASTQSFRLANPGGSGKIIQLFAVLLTPTVDGTFTLNKNGTLSSPTSHTPWNPNFAGSDTTVATAQTQTAAFTGGTALPTSLRTAANITLALPFAVLLVPGTSVGASVSYTAGGSTHVNAIYAEFDA
jgi:hypothetical protein